MEATVQRFVALLRTRGVRVSVAEAIDAVECARQPGILADRRLLRCGLRAALLKNARDTAVFDELFEVFFSGLTAAPTNNCRDEPITPPSVTETEVDAIMTDALSLSVDPAEAAASEGARAEDVRHLFDTADLAERHNQSQDDGMIDLSAPTDEIAFSQGNQVVGGEGYRIRLDVDRMPAGGVPGQLSEGATATTGAALSVDEQQALLQWLGDPDAPADDTVFRRAEALGDLAAAIQRHAAALLEWQRRTGHQDRRLAAVGTVGAGEQSELEHALRRIMTSLRGARTHRRRVAPRGRGDAARTMRRSLRYDGVPFAPVTVRSADERPRLIVLADVSLSVRTTAHLSLRLAHSLQEMFGRVRSFAFVAAPVETTTLFAERDAERALAELFGGDVLDLEAQSDYGTAFTTFLADHAGALDRRTTLLVLGDGRSNGSDPGVSSFAEIARRTRETIWITPEPRYSWGLGSCALPRYADFCDRVHVVRGLDELRRAADEFHPNGVRG
ncbi:VWA domain-containing protein [Nocardia veterana]|uniref:VWA domain-containing protein n=1 Tax=Nocardia veterana TaxID=132249 RepID=A0A7X6M3N1_9NOCA|nr:VWA domain-containing protein [Nocardia veterana]NKY89597.1 VWA domain-containing protein [Nocardia veterana]